MCVGSSLRSLLHDLALTLSLLYLLVSSSKTLFLTRINSHIPSQHYSICFRFFRLLYKSPLFRILFLFYRKQPLPYQKYLFYKTLTPLKPSLDLFHFLLCPPIELILWCPSFLFFTFPELHSLLTQSPRSRFLDCPAHTVVPVFSMSPPRTTHTPYSYTSL